MRTEESLYTAREVARIFGLHESRVRYWAQTGFINPSGAKGGRRLYTFADLVGIKAAKELLDKGISLQRVRRNIHALRETLPSVEQPLTKLRVCSDGEDLVVEQEGGSFEPVSGQMVLMFDLRDLAAEVLKFDRDRSTGAPAKGAARDPLLDSGEVYLADGDVEPEEEPTTGYGWFLRACSLDSDESSLAAALEAYRKALELDPGLAAAHTNMGNIYYNLGDPERASRSYRRACELEPEQPQAWYNLANLVEESGDLEAAAASYRRALQADPSFADAHFNLALTLERLGSAVQARQHWQKYLDTVERSPETPGEEWLAMAREHLRQLGA